MAEENQAMKEPQQITKEPQQIKKEPQSEATQVQRVTTKNPKKVEAGKRLAESNHKKREAKEEQVKLEASGVNQYYGIGAVLALGVIGALGYYIYRTKKGEQPNNRDNLKDGRPSNELLTYHVTDDKDFTHFEPETPQYKKLKNREFSSLTIRIMDQNNNVITDGPQVTVVLHICDHKI